MANKDNKQVTDSWKNGRMLSGISLFTNLICRNLKINPLKIIDLTINNINGDDVVDYLHQKWRQGHEPFSFIRTPATCWRPSVRILVTGALIIITFPPWRGKCLSIERKEMSQSKQTKFIPPANEPQRHYKEETVDRLFFLRKLLF